MQQSGTRKSGSSKRTAVLCFVSFTMLEVSGSFLNGGPYAAIAPYFGIGREISTIMNAVFFLTVVWFAVKRPAAFDFKQIGIMVLVIQVMGAAVLVLALDAHNPAAILLGFLCRSIGAVWATTVFSVVLAKIASPRTVLIVAGLGMVAANLMWDLPPHNLPLELSATLVFVCAMVPILLLWNECQGQFQIIQQSETATKLGMNDFGTFGGFNKFRSLLFCLLLVYIASGYSLTFNEFENAPVSTVAENVVLVAVLLVVAVQSKEDREAGNEDRLFSLSALLIIAGFLTVPYVMGTDSVVANTLLRAGRNCFALLLWMILASVGRRNIFVLLPAMGAARAASSVGTDIGAAFGHVANGLAISNPTVTTAVTTGFVFVFIAFLWLVFRNFSFTDVILGIKEVTAPQVTQVDDLMEEQCRAVAQRYDLTERETDILVLLARGRDGKFIAEQYVLSYNTVKTHIKHIYQKLDVHSRQDIINLVAGQGREA